MDSLKQWAERLDASDLRRMDVNDDVRVLLALIVQDADFPNSRGLWPIHDYLKGPDVGASEDALAVLRRVYDLYLDQSNVTAWARFKARSA